MNISYIDRTTGIRLLTGDNKDKYDQASGAPLTEFWCYLETDLGRIVYEESSSKLFD